MQNCPESSDFECFKTRYELVFFMTFCMISSEKIDNLLVRDNFSETSFVSISRHSVLNIKHSSGLDSK